MSPTWREALAPPYGHPGLGFQPLELLEINVVVYMPPSLWHCSTAARADGKRVAQQVKKESELRHECSVCSHASDSASMEGHPSTKPRSEKVRTCTCTELVSLCLPMLDSKNIVSKTVMVQ